MGLETIPYASWSDDSFVVMLVGVLFQLPSGLGNGGLFNFVQEGTSGSSTTYSAGFSGKLRCQTHILCSADTLLLNSCAATGFSCHRFDVSTSGIPLCFDTNHIHPISVGLFLAALAVHPFGGGRRRGGAGIFSF